MDVISRLKAYMEHIGATRSQFADRCGIPRPTLTQLLNGHNKKVSDDILSRIHDAYPQLSMMWLLFGEGEMSSIKSGNASITPPSKPAASPSGAGFSSVFDSDSMTIDFGDSDAEAPVSTTPSPEPAESSIHSADKVFESSVSPGKKIKNIMVFYTDNSYEIFTPT